MIDDRRFDAAIERYISHLDGRPLPRNAPKLRESIAAMGDADSQAAIDLYHGALDIAEDLDEPQILFPCYDGLATVHLDLDQVDRAEQYMEKAQEVCVRAGLDRDALVTIPFLCQPPGRRMATEITE